MVINEVPADSDSDSIRVVLLGAVVNNNLFVSDSLSFRNVPDFVMGKIEICVGTNSDISLPWVRRCSSFDMAGTHKSFKLESSMSLVYLVIVSFVTGWTTPLQTSSMLMSCWNWS